MADPVDNWEADGRVLTRRHESTPWALGDWLARGRLLGYDPDFARSARVTNYSRDYLYSLRLTAETFTEYERKAGVAWGVHREAARIPDPDTRASVLQMAQDQRWNQHDVRDYLRTHGLVKVYKSEVVAPTRKYQPVQVQCPHCSHVFPIQGHKVPAAPLDTKATPPIHSGGEVPTSAPVPTPAVDEV